MKRCIVCRTQLRENETVCPQCGFVTGLAFLSKKQYENWLKEAVEPYRREYGQKSDRLLAEQAQKHQQEIEALQQEYQSKLEELQRRQKEDMERLECEREEIENEQKETSSFDLSELQSDKEESKIDHTYWKKWIPLVSVIVMVTLIVGTIQIQMKDAAEDTTNIQSSNAETTQQESSDRINWTLSDDGKTLTFGGTGSISKDRVNTTDAIETVETIIIENGISEIGGSAFTDCEKLEKVVLPDSLQSIEFAAFHSCDSLKSITLPNSLQSIESVAFGVCLSLKDITFEGELPEIGEDAFWGVTATVYYPSSWKTVPASDAYGGNLTWIPQD